MNAIQAPPHLPRRSFLKHMALLASAAAPYSGLHLSAAQTDAQRKPIRIILDADTANEIDDLFALARALMEPSFQVEGINSAQWHTQGGAPRDTVGPSQELNEKLLRVMNRQDVPHPIGSNLPLVSAQRPQPSDAARHIIRKALATPEGEKLIVAILGPCTGWRSTRRVCGKVSGGPSSVTWPAEPLFKDGSPSGDRVAPCSLFNTTPQVRRDRQSLMVLAGRRRGDQYRPMPGAWCPQFQLSSGGKGVRFVPCAPVDIQPADS